MAQARQSTLRIVEPGAPGGASPRFTVDGRVRSVAGRLNATLELHLASDGSIIWSATFDRPMADEADMRRGAALKLADVLTCAVHDGDQASKDVEVLKLFLAACEDIHSGAGPETVRDLFRKVVARAPNFARGWTELAVEDALVAQFRLDALGRETTERDAARALALDPRQARAWVARALVAWRADEWVRRDADLRRALAIEPDEPLALAARAYALRAIGRGRDDLAVRRQAVIADPLSAGQLVDLALDEGLQGDVAGANATLDEAERRSPGYPAAGGERLFVAALVGDPNAARRLLDDPSNRQQMTSLITEYLRRVIAARADPKQADQAAAFILAHAGDLGLLNTIQGLAEVGHVDQALDVVQSNVGTLAKEMDWTYGFYTEPLTRLRASPRFMPLAARIGLVDIWRQTGLWPDFCTAPDRPYDCKAEAQKLAKG
jgi:Flp pilus assembly protein TadD